MSNLWEAHRSRVIGVAIGVAVALLLLATGNSQALVIGTISGAVYSLIALGLVLVYKSSGVFNFAQGEFGTVAVFALYLARVNDVPYVFAAIIALAAAAAFGFLTERVVIRPLFDAPRVTLLVATVGVSLLAIGMQFWFGEARLRNVDPALARGDRVSPFGIFVSDQRLLIIAVLVVLAVLLALFFSRTNLGLAVLAASQEPTATDLVGISVRRLSTFVWVVAALLGGVAGILQAPVSSFGPGFLTSGFLIQGFTAAVIGGMTSLPGAFIGGIIVGVGESLGTTGGFLDGVPGSGAVVTFVLLATILAIRPQGLLGKTA